MRTLLCLLTLLSCAASPALLAQAAPAAAAPSGNRAPSTINVTVNGAVPQSLTAAYPSETRISTVALAAKVDTQAYMLGAAWLRPVLRRDQARLRAGLLFELSGIRRLALGSGNETLGNEARRLQEWLATLPITGRRTGTVLDPYQLEVTPSADWAVSEGDTLYYPRRPQGIRVVGAVKQDCHLPLVPLQDARRYLEACAPSSAADRNRMFVVQPDGSVWEQKIALWNRDPPRPLAPGAWIYVPFDEHITSRAADDTFSRDVATFIGTQLLSDDGWR